MHLTTITHTVTSTQTSSATDMVERASTTQNLPLIDLHPVLTTHRELNQLHHSTREYLLDKGSLLDDLPTKSDHTTVLQPHKHLTVQHQFINDPPQLKHLMVRLIYLNNRI